MQKLLCDLGSFSSCTARIKRLSGDYAKLLTEIVSLESDTANVWQSDSQKSYYNKFLERKKALEELSVHYSDLVAFLEECSKNYNNIESKYS